MHFLIVCDKFKSSLSAIQVCDAIGKSLSLKYPEAETTVRPFADGGDGTLDLIKSVFQTEEVWCNTLDPLSREISTHYLIKEDTAFIELAAASGIARLKDHELNPMITSTVGTGLLIDAALKKGLTEIVLCLGGSCTHDAGMGIVHALGFRFLDEKGNALIPIGAHLTKVHKIAVPENLVKFNLKILCDVSNPLYGANGAAYVFAEQKGANDQQIKILDDGLRHLAKVIKNQFNVEIGALEGGGAAGGIAAGLHGLLGVEIVNGFDYLAELTSLEKDIEKADVIITGEGRLDRQSLDGKLVGKIAALARKHNKRLVAIVGQNAIATSEQKEQGFESIFAIDSLALNLQDAMERAPMYLERLAKEI